MAKNTLTLQEAYALLDVARSAGIDEVKQAYRKRAFALHPDLHPDNENAAMEFQRVNEAYVTVITYLDSQAKKNSAKAQFVNAEKARKSKFEEEKRQAEQKGLKKESVRKKNVKNALSVNAKKWNAAKPVKGQGAKRYAGNACRKK